MKRVLKTLIIAGLGGIMLAGCGSSAPEENPDIKTEPKGGANKMNTEGGAGQASKPATE